MNVKKTFSIVLALICFTNGYSQSNWYYENWSESEINLQIEKALNPTKVLYIAAHPDDENTRLISWLANDLHAEVAYLSLTNGSGGQNLISEEIGEDLGLIREQELLAARRIDGGTQFFTTAEDFGYSKSYEETFEKWGKQNILEQVVRTIRTFQPDIIITRFSPSTDGLRSTHGHHTASAILAVEAFQAAADPSRFPSQLEELTVWQADAIYWNTSYWSFGSQEKLDSAVEANPEFYVSINVDQMVNERGMSTSEIAAASRSMHKSQGFGTMTRYGETTEYLQLLRGNASARDKLHKSHVKLSSYFHQHLRQAIRAKEKSAHILRGIEQGKKDGKLNPYQVKQLEKAYLKSLGLRFFITADNPILAAGENQLTIEMVHYSVEQVTLDEIQLQGQSIPYNRNIKDGALFSESLKLLIEDLNADLIAKVKINGMEFEVPVIYRTSDPVKGEIIQKVQLVNIAQIEIENPEILIVNGKESKLKLSITPLKDVKQLEIYYTGREQAIFDKEVNYKANQTYHLELALPQEAKTFLVLKFDGKSEGKSTEIIKHDHIPWIYKRKKLEVTVHRINAVCTAKKVGYVMGAGDKVPEAIEALGAEVTLLDYKLITAQELSTYDAVVFGIRALNVLDDIDSYIDKFYDYAEKGGTLIMQYNTAHRLKTQRIGSKEGHIELSRGRVTEEDAEVLIMSQEIRDPKLKAVVEGIISKPNAMMAEDWNSWVQERGLYFPEKWNSDLVGAPLGMSDTGEETLNGSLLVGNLGEGHFVYTGISFFRELPAGVEGAYKLWANILSL